jgi:ligand-binding sensor domain-containing protein/signal transduction histidine kinase
MMERLPQFFWLYLLPGLLTFGQSLDNVPRFSPISVREGLSHSNVFGIVQDPKGFMWFATQSGLNRYDGYQIKVFLAKPGDPTSLPTNSVGRMLVDDTGHLWVGSWGEGVSRYEVETGIFKTYRFSDTEPRSFSGSRVLGVHKGPDGSLWFGTYSNGLNRYDPETDDFTRFRHQPGENHGLMHDRVWAIHDDGPNHLWIGTEVGLSRLDVRTQQYEVIELPQTVYSDSPAVSVRAIDVGPDGRVWVGSFVGLWSFEPDKPEAVQFHSFDDFTDDQNTTEVRYIYVDSRGGVWVGTMGEGLFHLPAGESKWMRFQHRSNERDSLPNNFVESIYEDQSRVLWIATYAGLCKYDLKLPKFERFIHKPGDPLSLNRNEISTVFEDMRGRLWVGTFGGGINRVLDRKNFTTKAYTPQTHPGLTDDVVRGMADGDDGHLWVGTYRGGLHRFDPEAEVFTAYKYDRQNPNSISSDQVRSLFRDDKGRIWIGTIKGLNLYEGGQFRNGFNNAFYGRYLLNLVVNDIDEDDRGDLWLGTESGLIHFSEERRHIQQYRSDANNIEESLSHNNIQILLHDSKGRLWAGSYSGLNLFLPETQSFRKYFVEDGLPGNMILSMVEDGRGMIWMGTNVGLSRLDPDTGAFRNYDIHDGLLDNGFNRGTECITRDGMIYIGGTKGLNRFDPLRIQDNPFIPKVAITGMLRLNEPMVFQKPIYEQEKVTLEYTDKVFSIKFAALDYTLPEKNQYHYKLEGFNDDWIDAGTKRQVTYTNLDSGNYTFMVRGSNNDGLWNAEPAKLVLRIEPPIWATWWALTIYAVIIGMVVFWLPYLRIRQLNNRRRELSLLVKQRTVELHNKAKRLEDLNDELLHLDSTVRMINHEVSSEQLWEQLLEQGISLLPNAQKGVILFYNNASEHYEVVCAVGHQIDSMRHLRFTGSFLEQCLFNNACTTENEVVILQEPQPFQMGELPKAKSLMVMCLHAKPHLAGYVLFENYEIAQAFKPEDLNKIRRFKEHARTAVAKAKLIEEVTHTADHLKSTQRLLLETAHQAGMAEIASSVLHNVGNTLNSINTSVDVLQRHQEASSWRFYERLKERLEPHQDNLGQFFVEDKFGRKVPEALWQLSQAFAEDMQHMFDELDNLREHLESLRVEVQSQQAIARSENLNLEFSLATLLEEVLQIQEPLLKAQKIQVVKSLTPLPLIRGQVSKLKNVLIHLINNAVDAMSNQAIRRLEIETHVSEGKICLKLTDNGTGIEKHELEQVFRQGYSTDHPGSTFGLHYCAIALREMAGDIRVESDGKGTGCCFTLTLKPAASSEGRSRTA